jgi:hypothetical protein
MHITLQILLPILGQNKLKKKNYQLKEHEECTENC